MDFFTRELYLRFNSSAPDVADRADEEWEQALRDYEKRLVKLRRRMPQDVRELADRWCFHDAEVVWNLPVDRSVAMIFLEQEDKTLVVLTYVLTDRPFRRRARKSWPFAAEPDYWLYDEVDADPRHKGGFLHRILLSSGTELEIPFSRVAVRTPPARVARCLDKEARLEGARS